MRIALGERLRRVTNRLAVFTFRMSIALFEAELLDKLSRARRKARALFKRRGQEHIAVAEPRRFQIGLQTSTTSPAHPKGAGHDATLPIVFIHEGNSQHLTYSLAQAKASNPDATVFLLGDDSNDTYPYVEHHQFRDYFAGASQFERVYKHYSTNSPAFELICFQRWFILRDFLTVHGIDRCVYLDSDVLLYADVTDEIRKFRRYDFTLCWNTIGCVVFFTNVEGLDRLCHFMADMYAGKDRYHYDKMVAHFGARQRNRLPGGVCDMTALGLYSELNFGRVAEASHIIDGSVYDPNINMPQPGFEMENGVKKVVWKNGQPYRTYLPTREQIRFNSLHFNGTAKSLMEHYCTARVDDRQLSAAPTVVGRKM